MVLRWSDVHPSSNEGALKKVSNRIRCDLHLSFKQPYYIVQEGRGVGRGEEIKGDTNPAIMIGPYDRDNDM